MKHGRTRALMAAGLAAVAIAGPAAAAMAASQPTAPRYSGSDRYGTSAAVAQAAFASGTRSVILASGTNYPDALAAAYASGRNGSPILLTDPNNLSAATANEMKTLGATAVEIVGGTAAVSANVQTQLQNAGYTVTRISGADRYGTAAAIATSYPASFVASLGTGGPTAIMATGLGFADSLAGGPISQKSSFPVLLTDPNTLPTVTQNALNSLGIKQVILLGGTSAVGTGPVTTMQAMGITVTRIGGADRTDTAQQVATFEGSQLGWTSYTTVVLARGDDFADALSGAPLAGQALAPILLTENPNTLGTYTTSWLQSHNSTITAIDVLGGTAAISDSTVQAAQAAG